MNKLNKKELFVQMIHEAHRTGEGEGIVLSYFYVEHHQIYAM